MSSFQSNSASNYREEIPEFEVILNKIQNILRTEEQKEGAEAVEQNNDPIDYDESMLATHYDIDGYQEYLHSIEECNANDTTADQVVPMTFDEWLIMNYDASFQEEDEYEAEEDEDEESRKEREEYYEECRKEEAFEVYKQGKIDDMFRGRR